MFSRRSDRFYSKLLLLVLFLNFLLLGCSVNPKASDFGGEWVPINQFSDDIKVIPLEAPYKYSGLRIDTSLRQMLERWARDTGLSFQMKCVNDYSIPHKILSMNASNLKAALDEVNEIYLREGLKVFLDESRKNLILSCDRLPGRVN